MQALLILALAAAGPGPAAQEGVPTRADSQALMARHKLWAFFHEYLAGIAHLDPEKATWWGVHGGDDRLSQPDDETRAQLEKLLERFLFRLVEGHPLEPLEPADQVDFRLFEEHLEASLFELRRRDRRSRSPQDYLRMEAIGAVLHKERGGYDSRVTLASERMRALPEVLARGRVLLDRPPLPWTEGAVFATEGALDFLRALPAFGRKSYDLEDVHIMNLEQASAVAVRAVQEYQTFLRDPLLVRSKGGMGDGREVFEGLLKLRHGCTWSVSSVRRRAGSLLRGTRRELRRSSKRILPGGDWRTVLREAEKEFLPADKVLAGFAVEARRLREDLRAKDAMGIAGHGLAFLELPPYLRQRHALHLYKPPGRLDDEVGGVLYVALPPPEAEREEAEAILARSASRYRMQAVLARDAWPGAHLLASRIQQLASPIRRVLGSGLVLEGWRLYAGLLADEEGLFTSEPARFMMLHDRLLAAARALVDIDLHVGEMDFEEAVAFLREETAVPDWVAKAEVMRISEDPTTAAIGVAGYRQLLTLRQTARRRAGKGYSKKGFHERLLKEGAVSLEWTGPPLLEAWEKEANPL